MSELAPAPEPPETDEKATTPRVRKSVLSTLSGIGGVVGLLASGAQVIDYAQNNTSLLFFFVGGLLIFLPFAVAVDYLRRHGQRTAIPYVAAAFACVSLGVLVVVTTANLSGSSASESGSGTSPSEQGMGSGASSSATPADANQKCKAVPDLKGDPARVRICDSLRLVNSAADLDALDTAWGNPGASLTKGADIALSTDLYTKLEVNSKGFIAVVDEPLSYKACKAQTVWSSVVALSEVGGKAACVITDKGRLAGVFIMETPASYETVSEVHAFVIVWNSAPK